KRDWSSDVCSSDLLIVPLLVFLQLRFVPFYFLVLLISLNFLVSPLLLIYFLKGSYSHTLLVHLSLRLFSLYLLHLVRKLLSSFMFSLPYDHLLLLIISLLLHQWTYLQFE